MKILALDTATPATAVTLLHLNVPTSLGPFRGTRDVVSKRIHVPSEGERPGHARHLLPFIHEVMDEAGFAFADLDRIGVGVGPGTFTGLRIGVSTARALALGAGVPLVGVSTLAALAFCAAMDCEEPRIIPVLDARRGEAFAAAYDDFDEVVAPAAMAPEALAGLVSGRTLAVGDGAVRFRDVLEPAGAVVPDDGSPLHTVSALAVARLAGEADPAARESVVPDYLRLPDAEIALRAKQQP